MGPELWDATSLAVFLLELNKLKTPAITFVEISRIEIRLWAAAKLCQLKIIKDQGNSVVNKVWPHAIFMKF